MVCVALLPNVLVLENINVSYLHACSKCKKKLLSLSLFILATLTNNTREALYK